MAQRKKHVVPTGRAIDGFYQSLCGRLVADGFDTESDLVGKIRKGLFRRDLHCGSCLRAEELNELIYVHSSESGE